MDSLRPSAGTHLQERRRRLLPRPCSDGAGGRRLRRRSGPDAERGGDERAAAAPGRPARTAGGRHVQQHLRRGQHPEQAAALDLALGCRDHLAGGAAGRAAALSGAAGPRLPASEAARLSRPRLPGLAGGEPQGARFQPGYDWISLTVHAARRRRRRLADERQPARVRQAALAVDPALGGALLGRVPRLLHNPAEQPGPLAPGARRRKADGLRLPERHHPQHVDAAVRPVVRGRLSQLLLLRPVPDGDADQVHGHSAGGRLQPGGAALLRACCRSDLLAGLQPGRGDAPLRAQAAGRRAHWAGGAGDGRPGRGLPRHGRWQPGRHRPTDRQPLADLAVA